MVSARIVFFLGFALVFFSIGMDWLVITFSLAGVPPERLNLFDLAGRISPYANGGHLPPNDTLDGQIWSLMAPQLTTGWPVVAEVAFPIAFAFGVLAIFRWRVALISGAAGLCSGTIWVFWVESAQSTLEKGLSNLPSFIGNDGGAKVYPGLGAYVATLGSGIMVIGPVLSLWQNRRRHPLDTQLSGESLRGS